MTRLAYWLDCADVRSGGSGPYGWRLLETLAERVDPQAIDLLVLCHPETESACASLLKKYRCRASTRVIPQDIYQKYAPVQGLVPKIRKKLADRLWGDPWRFWFASLKIDLLHVPYQYPPSFLVPCPYVVTMHDVQELHFPEFFAPQDRALRAERSWRSLEGCSKVVVSYDHVKQDLIKYFSLPADKIIVAPPPFQKVLLNAPTQEERHALAEKYADCRDFLLYPAQTWPHKNHRTLIQALKHIKDRTGRIVPLVCTGRKTPEFFPVLESLLAEADVSQQVRFVDIVPEQELTWLYENCGLVVIPTLYEAGSFPLLEAMFLQVPVICSAVTSLPDTIHDERFTFEPRNVEQLAQLILRCLDDREFRRANRANSRARVELLKGMDTFPRLSQAWNAVLKRAA